MNNIDDNTTITIIGIKPTPIHLGHVVSCLDYIYSNSNNEAIVILIATLHKLSTEIDINSINNQCSHLYNIVKNLGVIAVVRQDEVSDVYMAIFLILCNLCSIQQVNKLYKINYKNSTENNVAKFIYPILMAVDIILLQPCKVVVSIDQIHNIRIIKNIIKKLKKLGIDIKCIFHLLECKATNFKNEKMSTTDIDNCILINDNLESIRKKIYKIPTQDSMPQEESQLNESTKTLYNLMSMLKHNNINNIILKYKDANFSVLKEDISKEIFNKFSTYINLSKEEKLTTKDYSFNIKKRIENNFNMINKSLDKK